MINQPSMPFWAKAVVLGVGVLTGAPRALASPLVVRAEPATLNDTIILNYALTLEHLENVFYTEALEKFDAAAFAEAGFPSWVRDRFEQVSRDEASHVALLTAALGSEAVAACSYSFPYTDPIGFSALAAIIENVGVSAYLGAAADISSPSYVTVAGSILTTESRHQAWIQSAVNKLNPWSSPYDTPLSFDDVYSIVAPFITSCPSSNPALPFQAFPALTSSSATPGATTQLTYNDWTETEKYLIVYYGLSVTAVPIAEDKTAVLPCDIQGTAYAIVSSSSNITSQDAFNVVAGPVILLDPFNSENVHPLLPGQGFPDGLSPPSMTTAVAFSSLMSTSLTSVTMATFPPATTTSSMMPTSMAPSSTMFSESAPLPSSSTAPLVVAVQAPVMGDVDGILGLNFLIDLSIMATTASNNPLASAKPLYQDSNSSTFGPGPNPAFPGLVVLQNTTVTNAKFSGPLTNLAGLFQLNGVSKTSGGLDLYYSSWQSGAAAFGVGPSQVTVYYVNGTAPKLATSTTPSASDGLLSNIATVDFAISNRTFNSVAPDTSLNSQCFHEASYAPSSASSETVGVQIFSPSAGDTVGYNGFGFIVDLAITASSSASNSYLSSSAGYASGFNNQSSPFFKPGPSHYAPGLVVVFNTTANTTGTPFQGPGTNLAGLFQINVARLVDCDTLNQMWETWLVGKSVFGQGATTISAFIVNGTAPSLLNASDLSSTPNMISSITTVDVMIS